MSAKRADVPDTTKKEAAFPIDLSHLARQTMDDPELQREILEIFVRQADMARSDLSSTQGDERKRIAHKLKGAAQAVGAFAVAECAARLMDEPDDAAALNSIDGLVDDVRRFVAEFCG